MLKFIEELPYIDEYTLHRGRHNLRNSTMRWSKMIYQRNLKDMKECYRYVFKNNNVAKEKRSSANLKHRERVTLGCYTLIRQNTLSSVYRNLRIWKNVTDITMLQNKNKWTKKEIFFWHFFSILMLLCCVVTEVELKSYT